MPPGSTSHVFVWILGFAAASTLTARRRPLRRFVFLQSKYLFPASFGLAARLAPRGFRSAVPYGYLHRSRQDRFILLESAHAGHTGARLRRAALGLQAHHPPPPQAHRPARAKHKPHTNPHEKQYFLHGICNRAADPARSKSLKKHYSFSSKRAHPNQGSFSRDPEKSVKNCNVVKTIYTPIDTLFRFSRSPALQHEVQSQSFRRPDRGA